MDNGTAKPSSEELASVPHHLFNVIDPDQEFSLPEYQKAASEIINWLHKEHIVPFLVGGSGQYIKGLLEGWQVPKVKADPELRKQLEEKADKQGVDSLFAELERVDPEASLTIDKHNLRRIIRALEVCRQTGAKFSVQQTRSAPDYKTLYVGLSAERKELYRRVDARVDKMLETGLVEETRMLIQKGYGFDLPSMSSIGYKQIGMYLNGELSLEQAAVQIKTGTHRYIRHQYAWFHLDDPQIKWFDTSVDPSQKIINTIREFLR